MDEIKRLFKKSTDEALKFVNGVGDDDWDKQSVDSEWDVKKLVNHLVYECLWVPELLSGMTVKEVGDKYEGDILGDDPKAAAKEALEKATNAVLSLRDLDFKVNTSMGDIPVKEYLDQMLFDITIHGLDIAASTGQDDELDIELVDANYPIAEKLLTDFGDYGVFGSKVEVSEDADKQTKLLALVGRKRD